MRLDLCTWEAVETYLGSSKGIIIPIGSMEQHGPVGGGNSPFLKR